MAAETMMEAQTRPRADAPAGGDDDAVPRARWQRAVGWAIVVVATVMVWNILDANHNWIPVRVNWSLTDFKVNFTAVRFGDLFLDTTANGGDMGAHVWWPRFLAEHWLFRFPPRISGWAPDWYAGFPVGQYYFPLPAVAISLLDLVLPYNVAFKLVTVVGPVMLPAAAYWFARGMRAPWPAPPMFALAALGMLVQTRSGWQIYGGNIASTLAGEFSFTIGLAFALFGLGALAYTLDTGRRRWLPALLIAAAILSHVVVAMFIALAATLLWLTRRPRRTFVLAAAIGAVAVAIPAVWVVPLLGNHAYTQSMRYTKVVPNGAWTMWTWLDVPNWLPFHDFVQDHLTGPVHNTINGFVRALGAGQPLWLPLWMWGLMAIAFFGACFYARRSTFVLLALAAVMGLLFVQWPDNQAVWNTRFLPFWLLSCGLLAAMGGVEILRLVAAGFGWAFRWVRDGDLQDARARAYAEIATREPDPGTEVDDRARKEAVFALAQRRFDQDPLGWAPPERLVPDHVRVQAQRLSAVALAILLAAGGIFVLDRAWDARDNNLKVAIEGWARWNYSGYERKTAYPQFKAVIDGMDEVSRTNGNGRALWEPSSGEPDAINAYGTSLALELLPYFTDGRIGSMEGIYFESSATTPYHFLTVAECAEHPSNPVRGLEYGKLADDFDLCVRHLQQLGVRYLMLWTDEANEQAAKAPDLRLIKSIPQQPPLDAPKGSKLAEWKVYEVANSDLVVGMDRLPVVATDLKGGKYSQCWGDKYPDTSAPEPELSPWECAAGTWWTDRALLDTPFAASGPKEWPRIPRAELGSVQPDEITPAVVTGVRRDVDEISFRVDEPGKPVLIRESYFPNWKVSGAKGPYRIAPNLMVVVPTSKQVTLSYGYSKWDLIGWFITICGLIGLVLLARWRGAVRFAAVPVLSTETNDAPDTGDPDAGDPDADATVSGGGNGGVPPEEPPENPPGKEPEPALP